MTGSTHLSTWVDADTKLRFGNAAARQGLDSLFLVIDSLALHTSVHAQVWGFHRMPARRFPYAIATGFES
jgi:hypothetical protein